MPPKKAVRVFIWYARATFEIANHERSRRQAAVDMLWPLTEQKVSTAPDIGGEDRPVLTLADLRDIRRGCASTATGDVSTDQCLTSSSGWLLIGVGI